MPPSSNIRQLLDSIQKIAKVHNTEVTAKKIDKILKEGFGNLHVICDFDGTITKYYKNKDKKERSPSSHVILSLSSRLTSEFKEKTQALCDKYYPIEVDNSLTLEQKIPYMVEWWEQAHELIINQNIKKDDFAAIVSETPMNIREGLKELIDKCKEKNVPFLIFSAGLRNVIEEALTKENLYHKENMHIVSNKMDFNPETGICDKFVAPLIHVFNKSEITIKDSPYHQTIEDRRNVILLGDSVGDLQMSRGIEHDICLNIGFLNYIDDDLLNSYLKIFDIVVLDDGPMDVVNMILQTIEH
ncbi:pyrimidine 5'-nucleotidase [Glomus cerebriforme]|uniref:5'-nucleotidase n=1 Tax=Glomus cerebriforme TaxID=658196 RepID=A0A397SY91_9GLOM|nr:pyrimidine 5'-nucleotidase [Glomus cerebriforme]